MWQDEAGQRFQVLPAPVTDVIETLGALAPVAVRRKITRTVPAVVGASVPEENEQLLAPGTQ